MTCGAVIFPVHGRPRFFGLLIPEAICDAWRAPGKVQLVGQAELFPRVVAALTWPDLLHDHLVIWWHDNESARAASIRGYSPVLESCRILAEAAVCEAGLHCRSWFARVPTASNVSDPASRLDYPEVWRLVPGAVQSEPVLLKEWAHLLRAPAQV